MSEMKVLVPVRPPCTAAVGRDSGGLRVLLVGPCPPPHGGISVHVSALAARLRATGATCRVLNTDPRAAPSPEYLTLRTGGDLVRIVAAHARDGYHVHLHTNGHGWKSWLLVLAVGLAARSSRALVTLHSGLLPAYVGSGPFWRRALVRRSCAAFARIVCVNPEIERALLAAGVGADRLVVRPAFIPPEPPSRPVPAGLEAWLLHHAPVISSTLFFRPEYGLDLLLDAMVHLRRVHPRLGCLVMGGGDSEEATRLVRDRGLDDVVRLVGDIDHEDCLQLMARSDVFVRPTRADGDSISVREALALGVRTVASDVGRRPAGVHLYPAGNVDALVDAVEHARSAPPPAPGNAGREWGGLGELYGPASRTPLNEDTRLDAPTLLRS
jgi:glycogen synthase